MSSYGSLVSFLSHPHEDSADSQESPDDEPLSDPPSFSLHKTSSLILEERVASSRPRPRPDPLKVATLGASQETTTSANVFMFPSATASSQGQTTPRMLAAVRTSTQRTSQIVRGSNESAGRVSRLSSTDGGDGYFLGSGEFTSTLLKENVSPHLLRSPRMQVLELEVSQLRAEKLMLSQKLAECEDERSHLEGEVRMLVAQLAEQKARTEAQLQESQAATRVAQRKAEATERRAQLVLTYSRNLLSTIAESTLAASRRHTASMTAGHSRLEDPCVGSQHLLNRNTDSCLHSW